MTSSDAEENDRKNTENLFFIHDALSGWTQTKGKCSFTEFIWILSSRLKKWFQKNLRKTLSICHIRVLSVCEYQSARNSSVILKKH